MLKRYILSIAAALCFASTTAAFAACTVPNTFTNGTTADATQVNGNFTAVLSCVNTPVPVPTRQVLTSGSSATYTTPTNVRQLRIRIIGGGSGGGGSDNGAGDGGASGAGGNTSFNSVVATGGAAQAGGSSNFGGAGGTGGAGTASLRIAGEQGYRNLLPVGGSSILGFGSTSGVVSAKANGGGGGFGGGNAALQGGGGGGAGEYVELIINSPAGTYTYTVGAGGAGGTAGTGGATGTAGGSGLIIVDEIY